jgi:hypothetical protein
MENFLEVMREVGYLDKENFSVGATGLFEQKGTVLMSVMS